MSKKPLLVIDMQERFNAAKEPSLICHVLKEIRLAKRRKAPICIMQFLDTDECLEDLIPDIDKAVKNYSEVIYSYKERDSGAEEFIEDYIKAYGSQPKTVAVCGVNTTACVYQTVKELVWGFFPLEVELIFSACGDEAVMDFSGLSKEDIQLFQDDFAEENKTVEDFFKENVKIVNRLDFPFSIVREIIKTTEESKV